MKKTLFVLLSIIPLNIYAQKQSNQWYFGHLAGLDFNSGVPVPITTGALYTDEGSASIADKSSGDLLFYTDGFNVYDKTNNPMQGPGLGGSSTSTQSALIVPKPGSSTLYYVFTVDAQAGFHSIGCGGLSFNIVDMSLNNGIIN